MGEVSTGALGFSAWEGTVAQPRISPEWGSTQVAHHLSASALPEPSGSNEHHLVPRRTDEPILALFLSRDYEDRCPHQLPQEAYGPMALPGASG